MIRQNHILSSCKVCKHIGAEAIHTKKGFHLVKCSSCDLVYVSNPPSELELERLYSFDCGYHKNFLDAHSKDSMNQQELAEQNFKILETHGTKGRLLDIGCSAGFFLKIAKEHGWMTYGLELSKDTSEIARQRYNLNVYTGTLDTVSIEPRSFDVVTLWDVIEHLSNPLETMLSVGKILKDNGMVILLTPNIDGLFPKLSYKVSNLFKDWPHPEPPRHLFQFSKRTIQSLLHRTGFGIVRILDARIPITYTFGGVKDLVRSPRRLVYAGLFIPAALLGPVVGSGDAMFVIAKRQNTKTRESSM